MNLILKELEKSSKYNDFIKNLENKKSPIAISGLTGVAEVSVLSSVAEKLKRPIMLITYNEIQAQKLVNDFKFFTDKAVFLPKKEIITYDYVAESKDRTPNAMLNPFDLLNRNKKNGINRVIMTINIFATDPFINIKCLMAPLRLNIIINVIIISIKKMILNLLETLEFL